MVCRACSLHMTPKPYTNTSAARRSITCGYTIYTITRLGILLFRFTSSLGITEALSPRYVSPLLHDTHMVLTVFCPTDTDATCQYLISIGGNRGWEGVTTEVLLGYEIAGVL